MVIYQPFLTRYQKQRKKRKGLQLLLFLILCVLTSICLAMMFSSVPSRIASAPTPVHDEELLISQDESESQALVQSQDLPESFPVSSKSPFRPRSAEADIAKIHFRKVDGVLEKGGTLYNSLLDKKIKKSIIHTIIEHLRPMVPMNTIMPGDSFVLTLDPEENLHRFEYRTGPIETYIIERGSDGKYDGFRKKVELEKYWVTFSGQMEGSLFQSIMAASGDAALATKFADIFAWKIDFHNELKKGDKFRLIVEKYFLKGTFIEYGDILAAEYNGACGLHQAVLFEDELGRRDYYDLKGVSLRRAFLRAPLQFNYISSGYTYHRLHPILGYVRPHLGIDYAAPSGTPVWSVADGVVTSAGYEGGNGNQVIVRHMNGYQTCYNHLSRFGKGIKKGVRVSQKQVIGFVGTTGLSTGPHLDYRVKHYNEYINPLKTDFPAGKKLELASKKTFNQLAYNLLHFMYADQKEKWICKVLANEQKTKVE
ncbi:MAG: peptidoglycan DD-metalloendopeptidase family protein [bacterium]